MFSTKKTGTELVEGALKQFSDAAEKLSAGIEALSEERNKNAAVIAGLLDRNKSLTEQADRADRVRAKFADLLS